MNEDEPILDAEAIGQQPRRPCPMCGELIAVKAQKCRFCEHYFDPALRPRRTGSSTASMLMPVNRPVSAIAAGYLGLFSVLPVFGVFAIIAGGMALHTL